jgi:hypothetical protein
MLIDCSRLAADRLFRFGVLLLGALAASCGTGGETASVGGAQGSGGAGGSSNAQAASSGSGDQGGSNGSASNGSASGSGSGGAGSCDTEQQCDDNDKCTDDACVEGGCLHAALPPDDKNLCTVDTCDKILGKIYSPVIKDDNDACTTDACDAATGISHTPVNFNDNNACTTDSCDKILGVKNVPVSVDDNNACTTDACNTTTGNVTHTPVNINDNNACTTDACDTATGNVTHVPISISDNDKCTDDVCDPATGNVTHPPVKCDDNNICTDDTCNSAIGCVNTPAIYFTEGFANNAKGWDLGPTWQIGSATASSPVPADYNPDPAQDHTPTTDNGVAGVFIGGNVVPSAPFPGPINFLTSPIINLGNVSGPVVLDFFRWLNSDFMPFMQNSIDVFDGTAWVRIWTSDAGIADSTWTNTGAGLDPTQFDVTAYKNANFRFRFGYQIRQVGVELVSSWNLDDVRLVPSASCP